MTELRASARSQLAGIALNVLVVEYDGHWPTLLMAALFGSFDQAPHHKGVVRNVADFLNARRDDAVLNV